MNNKNHKVKKPIYKKWWFWIIIVVILSAIIGTNEPKDSNNDEGQDTTNSTESTTNEIATDKFIEEVKTAIQGAISTEDETIISVVLEDNDLCISVDLSNSDPTPLTIEDLAISRVGSITEAVLELSDFDSLWDTITVDFGEIGKVTNKKDSVKESAVGRYFPSENFILK